MEFNQVYLLDMVSLCGMFPEKSIDLILIDPPYGVTGQKWDKIIPFDVFWPPLKRVIKSAGAIVIFASDPFISELIVSARDIFKYKWLWIKNRPSDKFNAKNKPMDCTEDIAVFSFGSTANRAKNPMVYYPQNIIYKPKKVSGKTGNHYSKKPSHKKEYIKDYKNYPKNVLYFDKPGNSSIHPTQKPLALLEYLIRTYTLPGEIVLDPCAGSGTTGLAALNQGRNFILGDNGIDDKTGRYWADIARERIEGHNPAPTLTEYRQDRLF